MGFTYVDVYRRVKGEKLERLMARHEDAQESVEREARSRAASASAVLASRRAPVGTGRGKSKVTAERILDDSYGEFDWFVVLDDTNDLLAAWQIEYGSRGNPAPAPLRRAFGLMED